jgi:hypothetical protein
MSEQWIEKVTDGTRKNTETGGQRKQYLERDSKQVISNKRQTVNRLSRLNAYKLQKTVNTPAHVTFICVSLIYVIHFTFLSITHFWDQKLFSL